MTQAPHPKEAGDPGAKAPHSKEEAGDAGTRAPRSQDDKPAAVLKKASDPAVKAAAEAMLGKEKQEAEESNPGRKAPKRDSSDEDDAILAERLQKARW